MIHLHSEFLELGMVRGIMNLQDIFHPRIWKDMPLLSFNILSNDIVKSQSKAWTLKANRNNG